MSSLNQLMEFDHVIQVHEDGSITEPHGIYAPSVYWVAGKPEIESSGWSLMNGYSCQDRYSGPVMHPSEFIGGGLEHDILTTPGIYVAVVVTDMDCPEGEDDLVGWAVAQRDEC